MLCVSSLDDDQRLPILLTIMEGWSTEEVAELLGVPRGTILSRLHRGRQKLKTILASDWESEAKHLRVMNDSNKNWRLNCVGLRSRRSCRHSCSSSRDSQLASLSAQTRSRRTPETSLFSGYKTDGVRAQLLYVISEFPDSAAAQRAKSLLANFYGSGSLARSTA